MFSLATPWTNTLTAIIRRESAIIRIARGCCAIIILAIFVIFAFTNVISHPLSEIGLGTRVKTYRARDIDGTEPIDTPTWNVFVTATWDVCWYQVLIPGRQCPLTFH